MASNTNVPDAASFTAPVVAPNITPATVPGTASLLLLGLLSLRWLLMLKNHNNLMAKILKMATKNDVLPHRTELGSYP